MDLHQRLAEFFKRLEAAPPAANAQEALDLVCRLIKEVEDELCPIPREYPPPIRFTGRMYAPQGDRIEGLDDGTIIAVARHHVIYCKANGGIRVVYMPLETVVLDKGSKR